MGHLQRVELMHVKAICMVNTRDVVHCASIWCTATARRDHYMSDLTRFFMKILAGTTPTPEASDEPLTACDVHKAVWNGQTNCLADTRRGCYSQDMAPTVRTRRVLAIRLLRRPKASHAETWPQWTSRTNINQQLPEWCRTCSYGPVITIGPSDGYSVAIFQQ